MTKSLDFTGKTVLTVTSYDETLVKDYEVKVLVHQVNPDSLVWPMSWRRDLPGYADGAKVQKTVKLDGVYYSLAYDGTKSMLMSATSPNQGTWDKQVSMTPSTPDISSLTAVEGEGLCLLSTDGMLYYSTDGVSWIDSGSGMKWHTLLGAYDGRVLGIVEGDDGYYHDEFPRPDGFTPTPVEEGFPVAHSSDMIVTDNDWTVSQQAIIVGGVDSEGKVLNNVWGYDGNAWGKINSIHSSSLPAIADATLFPYYTYKALSGVRHYGLQATWYLMGGKLADGKLNSNIYLSNTQGITWAEADSTITQATHITPFYGAQAFVVSETLTANAASNMPRRVSSAGATWECPFIYLFGGYNGEGTLLPYVWRGVYIRMTNSPVY